MGRSVAIAAVALMVLIPIPVLGEEPCRRDCRNQAACEVKVGSCLIDAGRVREAVGQLKLLVRNYPEKLAFSRLLARAYLAEGNAFWAVRTLRTAVERDPGDCQTRSWLAWVYIQEGDLDLAQETLEVAACPANDPDRARWRILQWTVQQIQQQYGASAATFQKLDRVSTLYPEDRKKLEAVRRKEDPGWIEPFYLHAELLGGYTSNARAGSPTDVSGQGPASAIGRADLYTRFVLPVSRAARPMVEGYARAQGFTAEAAREQSYVDLAIRPGIIIGRRSPTLLIAYRGNLLITAQEDKALFYEAHRGELELETDFGLLAFAGSGRRIFRENGRTRTELDGGLGWSRTVLNRLGMMVAFTARYHWAVSPAYDLLGGTAVAALRVNIVKGFYARVGITPAIDYFLHSGGEKGQQAFGTAEERFDVTTKLFAGLWSPAFSGVRVGVRYEFSWRESTADSAQSDYNYQEHRVLAGLRYSVDLNPWAPAVVQKKEHVALDYGLEASDDYGLQEERIQDLLRQDEAVRASSSCIK